MNKEKIDDMEYYEKYLLNATKEERDCYIKEHPDVHTIPDIRS